MPRSHDAFSPLLTADPILVHPAGAWRAPEMYMDIEHPSGDANDVTETICRMVDRKEPALARA
jgi:hypothetical protein